jgi:hypothetical protein
MGHPHGKYNTLSRDPETHRPVGSNIKKQGNKKDQTSDAEKTKAS